jgi:dynein heavy chain
LKKFLYKKISYSFYIQGINHVISSFQETLLSIDNLIPDTTFDNFTRPYINEKYEEKTCGMILL